MKESFFDNYKLLYFKNCENTDFIFSFAEYNSYDNINSLVFGNSLVICTKNKKYLKNCAVYFKPDSIVAITPENIQYYMKISEKCNILYSLYASTYGFIDNVLMDNILSCDSFYKNPIYQYGIAKTLEQPKKLLEILNMSI